MIKFMLVMMMMMKMIKYFKNSMMKVFEMSDLGMMRLFLSIEVLKILRDFSLSKKVHY